MALPALFPLLRPECDELEAWTAEHARLEPSAELVEEGIALLPADERERIARGHAEDFPEVWRSFVADLGDELLTEALALALEAYDLWSLAEAAIVEAAVAELDDELDDEEYEKAWHGTIERQAARLATERHRRRLGTMVRRLRDRLPLAAYPRASAALATSCTGVEFDSASRERLLALLLADTLGPLTFARLGLAA